MFLVSGLYDYLLLLLSLLLVVFEGAATVFTVLIPKPVINAISRMLKAIIPPSYDEIELEKDAFMSQRVTDISEAISFVDICAIHGYRATEHVVPTRDGYILGIHHLLPRPENRNGEVVYLHHGLLMNSEIWISTPTAADSIAFQLVEAGYDVWLGNNRGNKYSKKHISYHPASREFWNFCLDEFALYDIPGTVDYILRHTGKPSITYIGFSQGSAQAFAALSIHPELNRKINLFIALGPAMSPPSVGPRILQTLMTASPSLLFALFGHRVILRSTVFWQSIMLPKLYIKMIDLSNKMLFKWISQDISWAQKLTGYTHLYSYTSVKCVVHWFQIIARNNGIYMFDDDTFGGLGSWLSVSASKFYQVPPYPTQNITTPIEIIYGTNDTLVDINSLLSKLPPPQGVTAIDGYEHLEMIWGRKVPTVILPCILEILANRRTKSLPGPDLNMQAVLPVKAAYASINAHSMGEIVLPKSRTSSATLGI